MKVPTRSSRGLEQFSLSLAAAACLTGGWAAKAHAADYLPLPVVRPAITCDQLGKVQLGKVEGSAVVIRSATVLQTPKGPFCKVVGGIEPSATFEVDLPIENWTQRFYQSASTGGNIAVRSSAAPAVNGELAVAINDRGGRAGRGGWTLDPAKRISWAYTANHQTSVVAKALIKAFYSQGPKFSYFMGCSGGGRESMIQTQRYGDDFDGVAAGAAAMIVNISNGGFFHSWEWNVNRRPDGSIILASSRLGILHDAVLTNCAKSAGVLDGVLQVPAACKFDPSWVRCASKTSDTSKCLTAEETAVVEKLYDGSSDEAGRRFEVNGFPLGSENRWPLSTVGKPADDQTDPGRSLQYLLPFPEAEEPIEQLGAKFRFNQTWFDKLGLLAPLYNGANTNLRPFKAHGAKLILWHGGADMQVQPDLAITYYRGVQKELGEKATDEFMRLFLLPGVGHCNGGDGPDQADMFSALMAWTELNKAPELIVAGKLAQAPQRGGGEPKQGFGPPYVEPRTQDFAFTRPVYPFPYRAKYDGKGDPKVWSSYGPVKAMVPSPLVTNTEGTKLVGPNNQKRYRVENGNTVPVAAN